MKNSERWIRFDDDIMKIVSESNLKETFGSMFSSYCAYMLFYERVDKNEGVDKKGSPKKF